VWHGFVMQVVQKASKAAYGLCQWARAMEAYDRVAKVGLGLRL
jgi:dynein heavy chain